MLTLKVPCPASPNSCVGSWAPKSLGSPTPTDVLVAARASVLRGWSLTSVVSPATALLGSHCHDYDPGTDLSPGPSLSLTPFEIYLEASMPPWHCQTLLMGCSLGLHTDNLQLSLADYWHLYISKISFFIVPAMGFNLTA